MALRFKPAALTRCRTLPSAGASGPATRRQASGVHSCPSSARACRCAATVGHHSAKVTTWLGRWSMRCLFV